MPVNAITPGIQQVGNVAKQASVSGADFSKVLQKNMQGQPGVHMGAAQSVSQISPMQKTPTAIRDLFNNWSQDQNSMNKIMKVALSGQKFSPDQLIVLQQATYKVTFELETMSKLVEQASSAVKTTMQTQV